MNRRVIEIYPVDSACIGGMSLTVVAAVVAFKFDEIFDYMIVATACVLIFAGLLEIYLKKLFIGFICGLVGTGLLFFSTNHWVVTQVIMTILIGVFFGYIIAISIRIFIR